MVEKIRKPKPLALVGRETQWVYPLLGARRPAFFHPKIFVMLKEIEVIMGLLAAVAALALLGRKLPIPSPILLVVSGLLLALIPGLPQVQLNPELVFVFFLPPLLYPAALFMPWRDFKANLRPISLLAIGLVLFTTVVVGLLAHYFIEDLPLAAGFVLGAIVSPPDAIAASAIAERLHIP